MAVPVLVRDRLAEVGLVGLPGRPADGLECQGARHHSPRPILVHEFDLGRGVTTILCGTCLDNLRVLQHLMDTCDGPLPWPIRREFGNLVRALAEGADPERA